MLKRICRIVFLAALLAPLYIGGNARAQKMAEFELGLTLTDTAPHGTIALLNNRAIGFDTAANDYYDPAFGEDTSYPGGFGLGNDFFFTMQDGNVSRADIRHKPATDSFALDYKMSLSIEEAVGSIFWDPSQIPAAVKGIWIRN